MEIEASFLAQQPQNFASIFLETSFPMLLLLFFLILGTDKTTIQTVCFYKFRKQLLELYFFETFSDPVEIGHAFCETYPKKKILL